MKRIFIFHTQGLYARMQTGVGTTSIHTLPWYSWNPITVFHVAVSDELSLIGQRTGDDDYLEIGDYLRLGGKAYPLDTLLPMQTVGFRVAATSVQYVHLTRKTIRRLSNIQLS